MSSSRDWEDRPKHGHPPIDTSRGNAPEDQDGFGHGDPRETEFTSPQGHKPPLRLGDAERIAQQRIARNIQRHSTGAPPALPEFGINAPAGDDVASRLIAALNDDGSTSNVDAPAAQMNFAPETPRNSPQNMPHAAAAASQNENGGLRAPLAFRPVPRQTPPIPFPQQHTPRPMPMGGPTRAPVAAMNAHTTARPPAAPSPAPATMHTATNAPVAASSYIPANTPIGAPTNAPMNTPTNMAMNNMDRAPVAPMRRTAAPRHGLRLREAPSHGITPPISRAQSLYEVLNRSQNSPRPMRRPEFVAAPQQSPIVANPPFYNAPPAAPAEAFDSAAPIAQEVQDAINVILQSLPKGTGDKVQQEDERAEALRRVRTLRAQLVGLQKKISLVAQEETKQPSSPSQTPYYHTDYPADHGHAPAPQPERRDTRPAQITNPGQPPQIASHQTPAPSPEALPQQTFQPSISEAIAGHVQSIAGSMPEQSASVLDYPPAAQQASTPLPQIDREQIDHDQIGHEQISREQEAAEERTDYHHPDPSPSSSDSTPNSPYASHQETHNELPAYQYGAQEEPQQSQHEQPATEEAWEDNNWDDDMSGNDDVPAGIYDDALPKGIVPSANDNTHSRSALLGTRAAGIIGGVALAASVAGLAVFISGDKTPLNTMVDPVAVNEDSARLTRRVDNTMTTLDIENAQSNPSVAAAISPSVMKNSGLALVARDVVGPANKPIRLALSIDDATGGDTATVVRIKGVPPGANLSGGFKVGDGTWLVPYDRLNNLAMNVPGYFSGKFSLQAQALAGDAVTAVSDATTFSVKIGETVPVATTSVMPQDTLQETGADSGLTSSTVNQTVPTASPEGVPNTAQDAYRSGQFAALPRAQSDAPARTSIASIIRQADALLNQKDIAGARALYRKAADLGSADAALSLGQTYDPAYFEAQQLDGRMADTKQALIWYQEALSRGNNTARAMVDRLLKWVQNRAS